MFKRFRRLHISLAAKCQILFGTAIALIIGAALFVPWQRMEQLTAQLDRTAAGALAETVISRHIEEQRQSQERHIPAATQTADNGEPAPASADRSTLSRLVSIDGNQSKSLTKFEHGALAHFARSPDARWYFRYYERKDGTDGYRYAQPVFLTRQCTGCHNPAAPASAPVLRAVLEKPSPTTFPTEILARLPGALISVEMPSRIEENQLLLNRVFILVAGLIAGTLAIVAFYLITTRLILQPVRVLQETAEKVSKGDLNIRSDISTGDEFQQLSETFNTMLANLKQGSDQLRSINKGLDLKLGQLAESNLALYESNRLKSEFLANVSHELRTPLNSILGFADLLKDALSSGPESKSARYISNILHSARHLLELINDLLDLAKIEAGRMEIRSEPLSLPDLFEGLTNILKPLTESKRLTLAISIGSDVPILQSDPAKLQQVLYNFLSNAIKFSPPGSRIDLSATRDDPDHVRIALTDQGPGIESDKQQLIFEKFRQVDASVTRTHGGSGLGLAISKELTSLLGGSIGVRSAAGQGATFWILLPLKIQAADLDLRTRLVLT